MFSVPPQVIHLNKSIKILMDMMQTSKGDRQMRSNLQMIMHSPLPHPPSKTLKPIPLTQHPSDIDSLSSTSSTDISDWSDSDGNNDTAIDTDRYFSGS